MAANYRDLSVTHLSSRLDSVDTRHNNNHAKALQRIGQVDSHHRWDVEPGIFSTKCSLSPVNTRVQGDNKPAGGHGGGGGAAAGEGQAESQGAQDLPQRHGHRRQQRGQGAQHPQV